MEIYTNVAWPDDPYRTGQQLYPRPAPRLAAFAAESSRIPGSPDDYVDSDRVPAAAPHPGGDRHRADPDVRFRAASITGVAEAGVLAAVADMDLMQTRRHATILTGCMLSRALGDLQRLAGTTLRGLSAVEEEWPGRHKPVRGRAVMFDCPFDLPGQPFLEDACQKACLTARPGYLPAGLDEAAVARMLAALMVERALIMALVCARHLGRYSWDGTLDIADTIAASTWDCFE